MSGVRVGLLALGAPDGNRVGSEPNHSVGT